MANKKFSDLTVAASLAAADLLAIAQGGVSKSITGSVLLTFVGTTYFPIAGGNITGNTTIATNKILLNADGTSVFTGFMTCPYYLADFPDASTNTAPVVSEFAHSITAGTPVANFGTSVDFSAASSTTARQIASRITARWTDATHATRTSQIRLFVSSSAVLTEALQINVSTLLLPNTAHRLLFGGITSSFPALQRASAVLVARLADDSADCAIRATAFNIGSTPLNNALSVYAAGTVYTLTATNAKIDFGTTDPVLTITAPGTYALHGFVKVNVTGATFAANQTVTVLIRRTNNTAGNITNSGTTYFLPIMTTLTQTIALIQMKEIFYTTANSDDVLELWADVSALPSAGSITVEAASLTVIRVA